MSLNVLLSYRDKEEPDELLWEDMLNTGLRMVVYSGLLPNPFMSSAERTGAAIFQKELDFTRNRLVDVLKEDKIRLMNLLGRFTGTYPLAVRNNATTSFCANAICFRLSISPTVLPRLYDVDVLP